MLGNASAHFIKLLSQFSDIILIHRPVGVHHHCDLVDVVSDTPDIGTKSVNVGGVVKHHLTFHGGRSQKSADVHSCGSGFPPDLSRFFLCRSEFHNYVSVHNISCLYDMDILISAKADRI